MTKLVKSTGSSKKKQHVDLRKINKAKKQKISAQKENVDAKINKEEMKVKESKKAETMKVKNAFKSGQVKIEQQERLELRDARSLFLRFTDGSLPTSVEQVQKLHPDIVNVRCSHRSMKQKSGMKFVFAEFENEDLCVKAKAKLATTRFGDQEIYVDYMGKKSKNPGKTKPVSNLNLTKLCIRGLPEKMTKELLKKMFPKSQSVEIVERHEDIGFINFSNMADAKKAFDDSVALNDQAGPKMIVVYADKKEIKKKDEKKKIDKKTKIEENSDKKSLKRKQQKTAESKKAAKQLKLSANGSDNEVKFKGDQIEKDENSLDETLEDDSSENDKKDVKTEAVEEANEDDTDDNDDTEDDENANEEEVSDDAEADDTDEDNDEEAGEDDDEDDAQDGEDDDDTEDDD